MMILQCTNCEHFIESNEPHNKCDNCGKYGYFSSYYDQEDYIDWLRKQGKEGQKKIISIAINEFAAEMKKRMYEKIDKGCRGSWEDKKIVPGIAYDMMVDCVGIDGCIFANEELPDNVLVDIANRAMIIRKLYEGDAS